MKEAFRPAKLGGKNLARLEQINTIIEQYGEMGYVLTLRQLYYRLVTNNIIPNSDREYAKLIHILTEGRMSGQVDWAGIEDRVRVPRRAYFNHGVGHAIEDAVGRFRLNRQIGQENHVELWVEKDAISNILSVKTNYYGIYLMVNRGFSSTTAMYDASKRIQRAIDQGKKAHILYLGDHDPSGLYMALRDIPERLNEAFGVDVDVKHIGITMDQVRQYNPPPNPAKVTDSRSKWYMERYGNTSWEVDALEPDVLHSIIDTEVEALLDMDMFRKLMAAEDGGREEIKAMPEHKEKLKETTAKLNIAVTEKANALGNLKLANDRLESTREDLDRHILKVAELEDEVSKANKSIESMDGQIKDLLSKNSTKEVKLSNIARLLKAIDTKDKKGTERAISEMKRYI